MSQVVGDPGPSASGARLTGDDLQHLVAWYWALNTLRREHDIEAIEIEALEAGNVDDVVVRRRSGPSEFIQSKVAVRGESGVTTKWLMAPSRAGGPSILQKFHRTWKVLGGEQGRAKLALITNRTLDTTDPVLGGRDRNGQLSAALRRARKGSAEARARTEWAAHLEVSEAELCLFLEDLRLETDALESKWFERVADVSLGLGLRADEAAVRLGIAAVREWVKTSRRRYTFADVGDVISRLQLRAEDLYGVLAICALDRDSVAADATVVLDWVDRFEGEEPRTRRQLRNPVEWNAVLRPQLREATQQIRAAGYRRVLVRGSMRLPSWFTTGVYLGETAQFEVATLQGGELWSSDRSRGGSPMALKLLRDEMVGAGPDLAVAIAVSIDPSAEVVHYLATVPRVGRYVAVTTPNGPGGRAISNAYEAIAGAVALRDRVRELVVETQSGHVHLFLAAPHGFALLLGHLWDRLPKTQLYEDLGSGRGYAPSFLIAN